MAIYHFSVKIISRGKGQSAVASAAYRRATILKDERLGKIHDYSKKGSVIHSEILVPGNSPKWAKDICELQLNDPKSAAEQLWNHVEHKEKRIDSELSREIVFALPIELNQDQGINLSREFIQEQFCKRGMIADFSVHWEADNPHCHVMLSTRELKQDGFGNKVRGWRDKSLLNAWREAWALHVNRALLREGYDSSIDHRSYAEQGVELIPTKHEGPVRHLWRKDIRTNRVEQNKNIRLQNLQSLAERPELLLNKISNGYSSFSSHQILKSLSSYIPGIGKKRPTLRVIPSDSNEKCAWQGTEQEIDAVFKDIAKNESVFSEKALVKILEKLTPDAEAATRALLQVKASTQLMAIGPGEDGRERYTTRNIFDLENVLQELADKLYVKNGHRVSLRIINKFIKRYQLKDDQADAIRHVLLGPDISAIVGRAGTGKSYSLQAAHAAWEAAGFRVHGIALAGIAADGLQSDSKIQSRTIASFCQSLRQGGLVLNKRDIVVMDEAGMTDSLAFFDVLLAVNKAKAKLVLVGDCEQLQPIGLGAPFRALLERIGYAELSTIRRQTEEWQREATLNFARGKVEEALEAYHSRDCIELLSSPAKAMEKLVEDWYQAVKRTNLEQTLILAYRNVDVDSLNQLARQKRIAKGEITLGTSINTAKGIISIAVGERIMFLENQWNIGIRNGNRGTVTGIEYDNNQQIKWIRVVLDGKDAKIVQFNPVQYNNFSYGYASTVHRAQGITVDKTFVLASGNWVSNLIYVAMTRHRNAAKLYANTAEYPNIALLKKSMSRKGIKDSVLDYPLAFAVRRGINVESIAERIKAHVKNKLKEISVNLKNKLEETLNPQEYWARKAKELEQHQSIQKTLARREEAKLVASYIDANRYVGKLWASINNGQYTMKNPLKALNEAKLERNKLAASINDNYEGYSHALEHCSISLDSLRKQALRYHSHIKAWDINKLTEKPKVKTQVSQNKITNSMFHENGNGIRNEQQEKEYVRKLEQESIPVKGTIAEEYLKIHCGINGEIPKSFRFNVAVKEPQSGQYFPALLVIAQDRNSQTQAVQATFLDKRTANKADIAMPNRIFGPLKGASVLVQQGSPKTFLAERPETALSVASAYEDATVYASLDVTNMKNVAISSKTKLITICVDNDGKNTSSDSTMMNVVDGLTERGIEIKVCKPSEIGKNFNDVLRSEGKDAVLTQLNNIYITKPAKEFEFKMKLKQFNSLSHSLSQENIVPKMILEKELGELASLIKNDGMLTETARRHNVYHSVYAYARTHQEYLNRQMQVNNYISEMNSKKPMQDFIDALSEQNTLSNSQLDKKARKEPLASMNLRVKKLAYIIGNNPLLLDKAIKKGYLKEISKRTEIYKENVFERK